MKKATRMLGLLMLTVMVVGILCGCSLFTKDTEKYRSAEALKIGNETITVGKIIDTFNNYYNNYYSYVSQGYITTDYLLELTISSLYTQYMKLDAYKTASGTTTYTHSGSPDLTNSQYLTDAELEYAVLNVKYLLFTTLDSLVEDYIAADGYTLNDAEEEDTSRDFVEYDDLGGKLYSEYTYNTNITNEDMDKYIEDYYQGVLSASDLSVDNYVYSTETAGATQKVADINARIDEDADKITFAQYQEWQTLALAQYKNNVMNSYKYNLEKLIRQQAEDMIISVIVNKYDYNVYKVIDNDNIATTVADLQSVYTALLNNQKAQFAVDKNFVTYIESLSDSSYIFDLSDYDLNNGADNGYIFVKNILIPFTDEQTAILSNLENELGSSTDSRYLAKRNEFASQVVADNFLSEQDSDGNYETISDLFTLDSDKNVVVNQNCEDTSLSAYLNADGTVNQMTVKGDDGKDVTLSADETIIELMKKFNTDTAQHSTIYDYVVRVGENIPDSYSSSWVSEFVTAAQEAYDIAQEKQLSGGTYSIAISTYGVHIVYYSKNVQAQKLEFSESVIKNLDTTTPEYRLFKTYFEAQQDILSEEASEALQEEYYLDADGKSKIQKLSGFDSFIKDNGFSFDFTKSITISSDDE